MQESKNRNVKESVMHFAQCRFRVAYGWPIFHRDSHLLEFSDNDQEIAQT